MRNENSSRRFDAHQNGDMLTVLVERGLVTKILKFQFTACIK